jgi:hypothetical protein
MEKYFYPVAGLGSLEVTTGRKTLQETFRFSKTVIEL